MDEVDLKRIKERVFKENIVMRSLLFVLGVFLLAFNYNLFLVPNHFIIGGTSGLAIIFNKLFYLEEAIFIGATSILLIFLAMLFLGWRETKKAIIGSILYPLFISFTAPLAEFLFPYLKLDNILLYALIGGFLCGLANGLIYKTGFNTGGSDILMKIVNKYGHLPEGKSVFSINILIMVFGAIIFGVNNFVYSLIVLYLNTTMIDRILTGTSSSKMFLIHTKEIETVKLFIMNDLKTGVTIFNTTGGFSKTDDQVLMCVVPNKDYYLFKKTVLAIDPHAFFVINDCYEVSGGVKRRNLPFI